MRKVALLLLAIMLISCKKDTPLIESKSAKQEVIDFGQTYNGKWLPYLIQKINKEVAERKDGDLFPLLDKYFQPIFKAQKLIRAEHFSTLSDEEIDSLYKENYQEINNSLVDVETMDKLYNYYVRNTTVSLKNNSIDEVVVNYCQVSIGFVAMIEGHVKRGTSSQIDILETKTAYRDEGSRMSLTYYILRAYNEKYSYLEVAYYHLIRVIFPKTFLENEGRLLSCENHRIMAQQYLLKFLTYMDPSDWGKKITDPFPPDYDHVIAHRPIINKTECRNYKNVKSFLNDDALIDRIEILSKKRDREFGYQLKKSRLDQSSFQFSNLLEGLGSQINPRLSWNYTDGYTFGFLHNHPKNSPPSPSDIYGQLNLERVYLSDFEAYKDYVEGFVSVIVTRSKAYIVTIRNSEEFIKVQNEYLTNKAKIRDDFKTRVLISQDAYGNELTKTDSWHIQALLQQSNNSIFITEISLKDLKRKNTDKLKQCKTSNSGSYSTIITNCP